MRCATFARTIAATITVTMAVSGAVSAVLTVGAQAQAATISSCIKPGIPVCMDDSTTFVSADKMAACQFEVKEYVDRTMDFLKCLNEENASTGQELTRNVERFNCRLSGGRTCG
ncbi:hypothetical protein [Azospirillum soli]|uniref:hypothetical protein n=1 Tax=Azospirillum soli TaxID=1304799 RepID=UPI001AE7AF16|nr:hypothetical protein [Azospirillum soli]MBP2310775.1 hypothetical protein [Azospirillum soli]